MKHRARVRLSDELLKQLMGLPQHLMLSDVEDCRLTGTTTFCFDGEGLPTCHEGQYPVIVDLESLQGAARTGDAAA